MSKINSAESIRGLACLAVVFSHLSLVFYPYLHRDNQSSLPNFDFLYYLHHSPFSFFYAGNSAVYVFFVLSGFVLSFALLNKKENVNKKILSMSVKRYPRLAIPALISVLFYWLAFHVKIDMSNVSDWVARLGTQSGSIFDAVYDGTTRSFIFGESNYNWVLWTMQYELIGSFVIFILAYLQLKNKYFAIIFAILIVVLSTLIISKLFAYGMICFMIGMLFYLTQKKIGLAIALPMLLVGLYLAGIHNTSASYTFILNTIGDRSYRILSIASAPLIVYSILMNEQISKFLDTKFLVYLGKLSFSIYLIHLLVIYLVAIPLFNYLLPTFDFLLSSVIACIFTLIITFLVSIPYSTYIDDLSIKVGKMIEKKLIK